MAHAQYTVTLTGESPLLFHRDNLSFSEEITAWRMDPQNKEILQIADDRSPAWTWIGCLYHDGREVGIASDNFMAMLRESGAKLKTGQGYETFKKQTQYGIIVDTMQFSLRTDTGESLLKSDVEKLIGNTSFPDHEAFAKAHGFMLFVKRAGIGKNKHVRVRPRFDTWTATGTISVFDEEMSGLTQGVLQRILDLGGAMVGIGDWRPGGKSSGMFGRFTATLERIR